MAYYVVPDITDEAVVCQQPCEHRDCKLNREEWTSAKCDDCDKPLTAGKPFYYKDTTTWPPKHQCMDCAFKG
ncbi:MAG: hypothetical protein Q8O55_01670 [Dehalococcoidales bacterium]|nr:hypothetical protein [Dehalococcoidales bacterium]